MNSSHLPQEIENEDAEENRAGSPGEDSPRENRRGMSERLSQLSEDAVEQGGRGAKNAIKEGGFSDELKKRLEARIQDSTFRSENPAAFAELNMPVCQSSSKKRAMQVSFVHSPAQAKGPAMSPWQSLG